MIRRRLDEGLSAHFRLLVEDYDRKGWEVSDEEKSTFYSYIFEDVKDVRSIYIPYTYTGNGYEFYDEILFEDGSTHYFWNKGGKAGSNLLVEEVKFTPDVLEKRSYCGRIHL